MEHWELTNFRNRMTANVLKQDSKTKKAFVLTFSCLGVAPGVT